jgi:hypothetical protein
MSEIRTILEQHLESIFAGDIDRYHASTTPDMTLYEWYVTPHRIDGLPFHDFMMQESSRPDTAGVTLDPLAAGGAPGDKSRMRFDLAGYHEQRYGDTVICSYTMLISRGTAAGVRMISYNESRVLVRMEGNWKVVHVHKSPSWNAPFQAPEFSP